MQKFISTCKDQKRTLTIKELLNNQYGLPCAQWFVDNCPDINVSTYNEFIDWCGLKRNSKKWNKEEVSNILLNYENSLGRPIVHNDISTNKIGFSMIVINRLYGSLNNCKKEIGLLKTPTFPPQPFGEYKLKLDKALKK